MRTFLLFFILSFSTFLFSKDDEKIYEKRTLKTSMIFFPAGQLCNYYCGMDQESPSNPEEMEKRKNKVIREFYLSRYETTNIEYREYLYWLKRNDTERYLAALPDSNVWIKRPYYYDPFPIYYYQHPAYANCPIVGITHKQATEFCEWATEMYNAYEGRIYNKIRFRLPTENEWTYAAVSCQQYKERKKTDSSLVIYHTHESVFPFGRNLVQNEQLQWPANFKPINQASVYTVEGTLKVDSIEIKDIFYFGRPGGYYSEVAGALSADYEFTVPVYNFPQGVNGFYSLAGNVEELVAEYGITKGGSWDDTGYYLFNHVNETYDSTSETTCTRGFRIAMEVIEY